MLCCDDKIFFFVFLCYEWLHLLTICLTSVVLCISNKQLAHFVLASIYCCFALILVSFLIYILYLCRPQLQMSDVLPSAMTIFCLLLSFIIMLISV